MVTAHLHSSLPPSPSKPKFRFTQTALSVNCPPLKCRAFLIGLLLCGVSPTFRLASVFTRQCHSALLSVHSSFPQSLVPHHAACGSLRPVRSCFLLCQPRASSSAVSPSSARVAPSP
ncbi:hypothetical protein TRVL_04368 [Trypanosoma vivax]|nr:hypothetical protein TRVL_04368 [Trypanosoma vivax]